METRAVLHGAVCAALFAMLPACSKSSESQPVGATANAGDDPSADVTPTAAPAEPSPLEQLLAEDTLAGAIESARPLMTDTVNDTSPGSVALALWAAKKLRWADLVVKKNETSFARVRKDSESSRGKRMCFRGRIIQITKDASMEVPLFVGLMLVGYSEIARFIVVGDTGELVEKSRARLCGVVIGTYDYSNSAGGTGHAVALVGMFDLPANREP